MRVPAISVGYGVVTSKGATCVTGSTKYLVLLEKLPALLVRLRLPREGSSDLGSGESLGLGNLELDRVLHPLGTFSHERCVLRVVAREAQGLERFVDAGEIGLRFLDGAAKLLEDTTVTIDDSTDLWLERDSTETSPPGNASAFERPLEWSAKTRTVLLYRQRAARIGSGNRAEEERQVADRARHRPKHGERRPGSRLTRVLVRATA